MNTDTGTERLRHARRIDSEVKHARVLAALAAKVTAGDDMTLAGIARAAKVSPRFIYNHPDLRAAINLAAAEAATHFARTAAHRGQVTAASLRADCENTKAANRRLQDQLRTLERRLSRALGAETLAALGAEDPWPIPAAVQERLDDLDAKLVETHAELKRRDEELAAARHINRELMARLNQTGHDHPPAQNRPGTAQDSS